MDGTAIVITAGIFGDDHAKTAHGLIRDTSRYKILGVIDHNSAGKDAGEVLDGQHRNIPIEKDVKSLLHRLNEKPDYCVLPSFLCNQIQSRVYVFLKACRALILYTAVWS